MDPNENSLYLYTFISRLNNFNIKYNKPQFLKYIYFESGCQRINKFENLLWERYPANEMSEKVIDNYFRNGDKDEEMINCLENDLVNLRKKYMNYNLYLSNIDNDDDILVTHRKFLLNLIIFMNNEEGEKMMMMIMIQTWYKINIAVDILKEIFIPKVFAKWFKSYIFYQDYFQVIAAENIKKMVYEKFFYLIINNDNINSVEERLENMIKKYTHKPFCCINSLLMNHSLYV